MLSWLLINKKNNTISNCRNVNINTRYLALASSNYSHTGMPGRRSGMSVGILATPGSNVCVPECVIHIPEHVRREHIYAPDPGTPFCRDQT